MSLILHTTLDRANRRKDKSVSITFTTCLEQTSEEFMEVDKLLGSVGIVYFSIKDSLTQEEIDEIDKVELAKEGKSKSQRLRNVLYVLHRELELKNSFNEYYSEVMESLIQRYKDKIPE